MISPIRGGERASGSLGEGLCLRLGAPNTQGHLMEPQAAVTRTFKGLWALMPQELTLQGLQSVSHLPSAQRCP